ncbi:MAG: proton-conducting transporter membrane subunit [Endomicrobiia bacterium]|nr:proton-conducting transporter membrane subunit [Endomicrobiia bacterium]
MRHGIITLFLALPLAAAFLLAAVGGAKRRFAEIVGVSSPLALLALAVYVFFVRGSEPLVYSFSGWPAPLGVVWVLDGLSMLMLLAANFVAAAVAVYSVGYMKSYTAPAKYYALFNLMVGAMNALALSGDIFNIYVFLEIASVAAYALAAFGLGRDELEASFKYVILGSTASAFILMGVAIIYSATGSLNLADIAAVLAARTADSSGGAIRLAALLMTSGFALKAGLVPFHAWLPDVHSSAPSPVSAMLSGMLIKVAGLYAMARIFFFIAPVARIMPNILVFLGVLSMIVGVLLALGQWDFKRLLAYHSVSQVGYIALGLGLGTPLGIAAGLYHLINHAVFKSLMFLNAGAVEYSAGTRDLKSAGGLAARMPVTGATSLTASLAIAGVPPLNGFWSKFMIIIAAFQAGRYFAGAAAAIVSVLTLASFLKVQKYVFWGKTKENLSSVKEVPLSMTLPMAALAVACVLLGIFYPVVRDTLIQPAAMVLVRALEYSAGAIK